MRTYVLVTSEGHAYARFRRALDSRNATAALGDVLTGGLYMYGGRGTDAFTGSDRRDWIEGGPGSDVLRGQSGTDLLFPGAGNDTVDGGPGRDAVIFYDSGPPVTVDLTTGRASGQGEDTLASIADVIGTGRPDHLTGDAGGNALSGVGGSDVLVGGAGNDLLVAGVGRGQDRLFGGIGNDILLADRSGPTVVRGQQGSDRAHVDAHDDVRGVERVTVTDGGTRLAG